MIKVFDGKIDGKNLLLNSRIDYIPSGTTGGTPIKELVTDPTYGVVLHVNATYVYQAGFLKLMPEIKVGDVLTYSIFAKASVSTSLRAQINDGLSVITFNGTLTTAWGWNTVTATVTQITNENSLTLYLYPSTVGVEYWIHSIKIEKGTRATAYIHDPMEVYQSNGLTTLHETTSCLITEELNGLYELALTYPITDSKKFEYLTEENVIQAGGQLFRIYRKTKNLDSVLVNARHISYDLLDNWASPGAQNNVTGPAILANILANAQDPHGFTAGGNLAGNFTYVVPGVNIIESIMGANGLMVAVGGELQRDNFDMQLLTQRGANNGVLISYGKNIQGIEELLDMDSVGTRLRATGSLEGKKIYLPESYIDSPLVGNYSHPKTRIIDFPMDVINYIVTPEVTVATTVYKGASADLNKSYSDGIATAKVIATAASKERVEAAEKVSVNNEWQKVHTEYNTYYNRAVAWIDYPTATYATLEDLKAAIPKGNANVYEVTNADTVNGQKWYYWDSFVWADTGRVTTQLDNYTTAYNMLKLYNDPIIASMSTPTNVHSTEMKSKWKIYLTNRNVILTVIFNKTHLDLWRIRSAANLNSYVTKLRATAAAYFGLSGCDQPQPNYKVDFAELSKTEEYKNYSQLETVNMGDMVIIRHTKLNMLFTLRVIKITTDILKNRVDKIELGTIAQSLVSNFNSTVSAIAQVSARVNLLENTVARVNSDGVFTGGVVDPTTYQDLYTQISSQDMVGDAFTDAVAEDLASFDWVRDWDGSKVVINDTSIISPKIFSGINTGTASVPILTGVALGKDVLGGGSNDVGIVGYSSNAVTYQLKTDGSAVFGTVAGQQFIINTNGSIVSPTILANKILGGVLTLGGANNGNGTLSIINSSNKPIVSFDNSNATISLHGTTETFLIQGENASLGMYDYVRMTAYNGTADENSMWFHADHWYVESGYTEFSTTDTLKITKYLGGGGNLSVDGAITAGGHRVACNGNFASSWTGVIAVGGYQDLVHNLGWYPITICRVSSNFGNFVSIRQVDVNTTRIGLGGTAGTITVSCEMY